MQKVILLSVMHYLSPSERMLIAAKQGCVYTVRQLITQHAANPHSQDSDGMTALHLAARDGRWEVCDYIIKITNKLKLDEKNKDGQTALFLATLMGVTSFRETLGQRNILEDRYNPIIALLANAGAKVNSKDIDNLKVRNNRESIAILVQAKRSQQCSKCCKI